MTYTLVTVTMISYQKKPNTSQKWILLKDLSWMSTIERLYCIFSEWQFSARISILSLVIKHRVSSMSCITCKNYILLCSIIKEPNNPIVFLSSQKLKNVSHSSFAVTERESNTPTKIAFFRNKYVAVALFNNFVSRS